MIHQDNYAVYKFAKFLIIYAYFLIIMYFILFDMYLALNDLNNIIYACVYKRRFMYFINKSE